MSPVYVCRVSPRRHTRRNYEAAFEFGASPAEAARLARKTNAHQCLELVDPDGQVQGLIHWASITEEDQTLTGRLSGAKTTYPVVGRPLLHRDAPRGFAGPLIATASAIAKTLNPEARALFADLAECDAGGAMAFYREGYHPYAMNAFEVNAERALSGYARALVKRRQGAADRVICVMRTQAIIEACATFADLNDHGVLVEEAGLVTFFDVSQGRAGPIQDAIRIGRNVGGYRHFYFPELLDYMALPA